LLLGVLLEIAKLHVKVYEEIQIGDLYSRNLFHQQVYPLLEKLLFNEISFIARFLMEPIKPRCVG